MDTEPSKKKNIIEDQITRAITLGSGDLKSPDQIAQDVLRALDRQKILRYSAGEELSLLSAAGRVLAVILEDNTYTCRAISVYLGVTETAIAKSIKLLLEAKLIKKQKQKGRNIYSPVIEEIAKHPDVSRLISRLQDQVDESPF